MLSASPQLDFVDELFLYCPRWLHKDLKSNIREHLGELEKQDSLDELLGLLYSGIPYGWFWQNVSRELDREMLRNELVGKHLSMRELFLAIMNVHAGKRGKSRIGAKFPVHYSHTGQLLDWFPHCRIIHTTRNPKAVYASQAAKYLGEEQTEVSRNWLRLRQFAHINIQTTWTARIHRKLRDRPNYCLVRYEETIEDPHGQLERVCSFLQIDFVEEMLRPKQYGSSFGAIGGQRGVSKLSLERWRSDTSLFSQKVMDFSHSRANRLLGYRSGNG